MSFIGDFQKETKRQSNRGRCLHFSSDVRCNEIISAHSIQKKGQLDLIAEDGHVYRLNSDLSTLKRSGGLPELKKKGIKQASTFAGFCKYHDNALFAPIDKQPLTQSRRQISLYAYRCLCRELFVKENAARVMEKMKSYPDLSKQQMAILGASHVGQCIGLAGLNHHKKYYDQAVAGGNYSEFEYTYFTSSATCNIQLSGLIYPDYDFEGNFLQNLGERSRPLDLITFFTAPTPDGWAFCFAWHASSNKTCFALLGSLAARVRSGERLQDALLRFSLSCCENHAIRVSWWNELSSESKQKSIERMHLMVDPATPVPSDYLRAGCEGIANWDFEYVLESK